MKIAISLFFISILTFTKIYGQGYLNYSDEVLSLNSTILEQEFVVNLHIPETLPFASDSTKYPILIIFDSQHEFTYPHIIQSIDLLTSESQVPEMIIVGIPFTFQNRRYYTSNQKTAQDSVSGMERMEQFLFDELIPKLQEEYKASDFISVAGHSRTAFLVNYLSFTHSKDINLAIALSGFYDDSPLSIDSFKEFLTDPSNFPTQFSYYFSAGSTLEEITYLTEYQELNNFISSIKLPNNVTTYFSETAFANHITNYWISLPLILMDYYSDYNALLNTWFHDKLENGSIKNPVKEFTSDLDKLSNEFGYSANPNLTQIFSLASHYAFTNNDYETAIDFIKFGKQYYPDYLDFEVELINFYKALNDEEMSNYHKSAFIKKIESRSDLTDAQKKELILSVSDSN